MLHKTLTQRRPPQASDEDGLKRLAPHLPFVDRADAQLVEDAVGTDPGYEGIGSWDKLKPAPIAKGRLGLNATITLHGKKGEPVKACPRVPDPYTFGAKCI